MRVMGALLAGCISATVPAAVLAEATCYKPKFGNVPVPAEIRTCRFNAVVDEWLSGQGVGTDRWLQTIERVGEIGDNAALFDVRRMKPSAEVEVYFMLGRDQSIAATEAIGFRPGYFDNLEALLWAKGKAIVCETAGWDQQAFITSGGEITYSVGLRPSAYDHRTPNWFARIEFPQSSCEAP